ncbi:AraC family transcriptional regulator [Actinomyces ruminis]|uniref:AraC family transcriptional regulator n=1 Tax=Actinomyces ruminis TaxID=1937003 RepID=UPI00211DC485|nr:AraC family transcriptional regulator [Actinomyces ruminis]
MQPPQPHDDGRGYYAFMEAVGGMCPDEETAFELATCEGLEQFSPPIFAAFCSPDGRTCVERLARYKKLIGPLSFSVSEEADTLTVEMLDDAGRVIPGFLAMCEAAFLVNILRRATKEQITPVHASTEKAFADDAAMAFLGCAVEHEPRNVLAFSASDMRIPFVTRNDAMWGYFEPEMARRRAELDADATFSARVRSTLTEMLPAGASDAEEAARKLGMSRRTMQRRLADEGTTFQAQLNHTRELLAKHYLGNTEMRTDEIAYLLGYIERNSFLRAFSAWTGTSPSEYRASRP